MTPVIAIIGRPNVGKSTLFNCLTKRRDALVFDTPGLTRDRQYGEGRIGERDFLVIDTGGIEQTSGEIDALMAQQVQLAINEADAILFMVDGREGLTSADETIASMLRKHNKSIHVVVNKTDGIDPNVACSDFHRLGFVSITSIAAAHRRGVTNLIEHVLAQFPAATTIVEEAKTGIKVAVVGRPNVGKSTLINRILGEQRVVVLDQAGTTRDSIYIPFTREDQAYVLIDTAGVRRRGKVTQVIEKFSIIKTLQAIRDSDVVVMLLDARDGIVAQDLTLLSFVIDAGKALVIAINKWDGLSVETRQTVKSELSRRLEFANFAKLHFISAMHGTGVGDLFASIKLSYQSATKKFSTAKINQLLIKAITNHQPPLVRGRRIKLRYAHMGGQQPPVIVIHGNQTAAVPASYRRYLLNFFRAQLQLIGTPVRIEFRTGTNPYAKLKSKQKK